MKRALSNIISADYVSKFNKYVVRLGVCGESSLTVWLTERQMDELEYAFSKTKKGYSDKRTEIFGVWRGKYYSHTEVCHYVKTFRFPVERDLSDLEDSDDP